MERARYAAYLARRNLRSRAVPSLLTALVVALAAALGVTVTILSDGVQRGVTQAADAFGVLVIGPKGSAQELVLNTILLQGTPIGLIDQKVYAPIAADHPDLQIAPLAMADNISGLPIIGTSTVFFELRRNFGDLPAFQAVAGRLFQAPYEAVLGAEAAIRLGLKPGDRFNSAHGVSGIGLSSDVHQNESYTVVGILGATGSAYDRAVFTPIESIWDTHADIESNNPLLQVNTAGSSRLIMGRVTAALLIPFRSSYSTIYRIAQTINNGTEAQAAFPGQQLGGLFDLLDQGAAVLGAVRWLALLMAALTVLLSLYAATAARMSAIAIMRSLGADRGTIFGIILIEAALVTGVGVLLGWLVAHGVAGLIAGAITAQSTIPVMPRFQPVTEAALLLIPLVLGLLAGLIPAARAYRADVVQHLYAD